MTFVELQPKTRNDAGTGVRISNSEARGLIVTLDGDALTAVAGGGVSTTLRRSR